MAKKPFIIDVIPLIRIPLSGRRHFSYVFERKVKTGSLVEIPFSRQTIRGIVADSRSDFEFLGKMKLKPINKILVESFLTEKQLILARFISDYYISPLGLALKHFTPQIASSRSKNRDSEIGNPENVIPYPKLTPEQKQAVKKISQNDSKFKIKNSKFLLYGPASSGKTEVYMHSAKKILAKGGQALILLPEIILAPQAIERYGAFFRNENIAVLHSKLNPGAFYEAWERIRSGKAKIIIGSRTAVFAPFNKLKLVVVDEEHDISFKQWDMAPRYDARTVAEELAEVHKAKIIFGSATPRIETYFRAAQKELALVSLPRLETKTCRYLPPKVELADMRLEKWKRKFFSPISEKLKGEIYWALKNKRQSIIFINHQGQSAFSVCADCKTVLLCPRCQRALVAQSGGNYRCLHCSHSSPSFPACPKCKGLQFKNVGLGTQRVESELGKIFPSARIDRVDSQSMRGADAASRIYADFSKGKTDILVGTQMISKGWDLTRVALVGIIDADSGLSLPDFRAHEKTFDNIVHAAGRTSRFGVKTPGTVVIQTFQPENFTIRSAANMDYSGFYEREIGERRNFQMPPFGKIIRLVYQDEKREKIEKEPDTLFEALKKEFLGESTVKISPPHDPLVSQIRDRYRKQIIVRFPSGSATRFDEKIKSVLGRANSNWMTDVDPISII